MRLISALLVFILVSFAVPAHAEEASHKKAVNVIAPVGGVIRHTLPAMGRAPSMTDWGPEAGLFYGRFTGRSHLIVFPYWADANGSHVWGGVSHLDYYFPFKEWVQPLVGAGFNFTKIDVKNSSANDLQVFAPWFKLGMRFKLPVQGLSVSPYVAYLFQHVDMTRAEPTYHSALFGINLHYHFHHSLQATLKYYYRYTHDGRNGHVARVRFIARLHRRFGIYVRSEYAKQVFDEYVNILAGPAFIF